MPVSIPAEVVIAALVVGAAIVAVAMCEIGIAVGALRRTAMPAVSAVIIVGGLFLGLAQSAFEWIHAYAGPQPLGVTVVVIGTVLVLSVGVWRRVLTGWPVVALLAAGILYQFGWAGGRFVLPGAPVIGPILEAAQCQRNSYCTPSEHVTTADVELRIRSEWSESVAHGRLDCAVDPRPIAASLLRLDGTLAVEGGGSLEIEIGIARGEGPALAVSGTFSGQLGMLRIEFAHLNRPRWTDAALGSAEAARTSAIEFDGFFLEGADGGERSWPGRVSWSCI